MSTLPYWNEMKMMDLGGTRTIHSSHYKILTFMWHCGPCFFFDCPDITLLIEGEGPHLLADGRQTMNSVLTNKVVFFQGHMSEY